MNNLFVNLNTLLLAPNLIQEAREDFDLVRVQKVLASSESEEFDFLGMELTFEELFGPFASLFLGMSS